MRTETKCFSITCDNCKEGFEETFTGFSIFIDEGGADEAANNDNWHIKYTEKGEDKHYCPKCYSQNDDDSITIKTNEIKSN